MDHGTERAQKAPQGPPLRQMETAGESELKEEAAAYAAASDCRETMKKISATEQRGMGAGGKKPPARSMKQFVKLFEV